MLELGWVVVDSGGTERQGLAIAVVLHSCVRSGARLSREVCLIRARRSPIRFCGEWSSGPAVAGAGID